MEKHWRKTVYACYAADMLQAIVINVTPLIFVLLKSAYGLSYAQFGTLVLVNFATQVAVDILFSRPADRYGYRPFIVGAHIVCSAGFILFALTPRLLPGHEYAGFLAGTVLFAGAGGLFELLLSPIVDALPGGDKAKEMSLLHSMYAWGKLGCILLTSFALFAGVPWYAVLLAYAVLPAANAFVFARVPLVQKVRREEIMPPREMLLSPVFLLALAAILLSGAAETTMSQWSSTFMQEGLGLPKFWGDMAGVGGFSLMLGLGRLFYGMRGSRMALSRLLALGSLCAAGCYILIGTVRWPWVGAAACAMTGLFVSIAWPATLSIASKGLPKAGTALFALLAAAGDMGGSLGPWLTGVLTDAQIAAGTGTGMSLKRSALCAALLPLCAALAQWALGRRIKADEEEAA